MTLNRDLRWLLAALLFGLLVLPLLVYITGIAILGPYAHGSVVAFVADFAADLARLRWSSWALALGPLALVAFWRTVSRLR